MKKKYKRGQIVWQLSPIDGYRSASRAVFIKYDKKGFPEKDCILAIRIGRGKKALIHKFRWPLRFVEPS